MIDPEPVKRPVQVLACLLLGSGVRLGREEEATWLAHEPGTDAKLGIAVARRYVNVVDAMTKQYFERSICGVLIDPGERGGPEDGASALMPAAPKNVYRDRHSTRVSRTGAGSDLTLQRLMAGTSKPCPEAGLHPVPGDALARLIRISCKT